MIERILDECLKRGTCPLNRKEFDECFAGHDLSVQLRSACDFARQHDLAFGRSTGDQHFMFSRLPKVAESRHVARPPLNHKRTAPGQRPNGAHRKPKGPTKGPAKAWAFRSF